MTRIPFVYGLTHGCRLLPPRLTGVADTVFLERAFHKLSLVFTWWVNRKDSAGKNLFEGGFLGLDNIGVFDRRCGAAPPPPQQQPPQLTCLSTHSPGVVVGGCICQTLPSSQR